jgi:hypothetical protein
MYRALLRCGPDGDCDGTTAAFRTCVRDNLWPACAVCGIDATGVCTGCTKRSRVVGKVRSPLICAHPCVPTVIRRPASAAACVLTNDGRPIPHPPSHTQTHALRVG